jgi:hypothetical protein
MGSTDYRYELRCGDEVVATGHLSREEPLGRTVEPLLGEQELRLVVQFVREND